MEIVTSISGISSTTVALSSPTGTFAGFTAVTAGDFNGDAASDILLWNGTTKTAEIAFLNENVGETVGTVDAVTTVTGGPTGGNWAPVASWATSTATATATFCGRMALAARSKSA